MTVLPSSTTARFAAGLAGVLAATTLAACSQDEDPLDGIPAFAVDQADVRVVDAGADPQLLTMPADKAGKEDWETSVVVSRAIEQNVFAADEVASAAPAGGNVDSTTLPLSVRTTRAPEPGEGEDIAERLVHFEVGTPKHSAPDLNQNAATAEGFLMSWRTLLSGAVGSLKLMAPEGSSSQGRETVEGALLTLTSANVVFPDQPVGVGGSWTVDSRVTGAAAMARTTTYTVERIEGDTVVLKVGVEERPTQRSVSIDDAAGGTLEVEDSSTTSEGEVTVDLSKPIPVDGSVKATTRVVYAGPNAEKKIVQDITTAVEYGD